MNKITLTTAEMLNAFGALQRLNNEKLPVKGSYTVARILSRLTAEHEIAEGKRVELVRKYGVEHEDGSTSVEQGPQMTAFAAEFKEIEEVVLELEAPMIQIEQLGDIMIEPVVLMALEKFIA